MSYKIRLALLAGILGVLGSGCHDGSPEPFAPDLRRGDQVIACPTGCTDPDPAPSAPGYFLGGGVTPTACTNGSQNDIDADGLSDFCEQNLASAFAPQLYYYAFDEVGREPHWAARPVSPGVVRVAYLLSYYRDVGNSSFGCDNFNYLESSCNGHNGDSEVIALDLAYTSTTSHWVLKTARYSQHGTNVAFDGAKTCTPVQIVIGCVALFYPDRRLGYPRAYVARGKHANYGSIATCNNGGFGGSDTCEGVNTAARVAAGAFLNIGSRSFHTAQQDCMPSSNPSFTYFGSGRIECYWSADIFRGWIPLSVGGAASTGYSVVLAGLGF